MAESISPQNKTEATVTHSREVVCDGPAFSKHPRVYLKIEDDENGNPAHVTCPYCSKVFVYQYAPALTANH